MRTWRLSPADSERIQASLLTARAGFDGVFFARADYDDLARRKGAAEAEAVWRAAPATYGAAADVFLGNFPNHYGPPHGFNFEWGSTDPPIQVQPPPPARIRPFPSDVCHQSVCQYCDARSPCLYPFL